MTHPDLIETARAEFDAVPGDRPNQLDRQRPEVHIEASDLLDLRIDGEVTDEGVRANVSIAVRYLESWLRVVTLGDDYPTFLTIPAYARFLRTRRRRPRPVRCARWWRPRPDPRSPGSNGRPRGSGGAAVSRRGRRVRLRFGIPRACGGPS